MKLVFRDKSLEKMLTAVNREAMNLCMRPLNTFLGTTPTDKQVQIMCGNTGALPQTLH